MQAVKRIEVVVEAAKESAVEKLIKKAGIDGYTLFRNVAGRGHRGERDTDGLTTVFRNVYFIIAADPDATERFVQSVQPLLEEVGGMCLVSDADWVKH